MAGWSNLSGLCLVLVPGRLGQGGGVLESGSPIEEVVGECVQDGLGFI